MVVVAGVTWEGERQLTLFVQVCDLSRRPSRDKLVLVRVRGVKGVDGVDNVTRFQALAPCLRLCDLVHLDLTVLLLVQHLDQLLVCVVVN